MDAGAVARAFDPDRLTPLASLNTMPLLDLAGLSVSPASAWRTAYHVLAAPAIAAQVREHADPLGLADTREADDDTVLRHFAGALVAPDPALRMTARTLADRCGDLLALLVATLRRGDADSRRARPDWSDGHWSHRASITSIYLGGGLVSGHLGAHLEARRTDRLRRAGIADCTVRRADWPTLLPHLGAAHAALGTSSKALVFDFGQSFVKRAAAHYVEGELALLRLLPAVPIRALTATIGDDPTPEQVRGLADRLLTIIVDSWHAAQTDGRHRDAVLSISLASYVHDGQPLPRRGGPYAPLHNLSPNLAVWLADRLLDQLGSRPELVLLHDSSAAALAVPRDPHAAVIMLGTALGVGFPSLTRPLRPRATNFAVLAR